MFKLIYLYILECSDKTLYVGVTNNPERRLMQHNLGQNKTAYTYNRRPVKIIYAEGFRNFQLAFDTETRIKKWSKAKKLALAEGKFDLLVSLSKKNSKSK